MNSNIEAELEKFRNLWRKEVQFKRHDTSVAQSSSETCALEQSVESQSTDIKSISQRDADTRSLQTDSPFPDNVAQIKVDTDHLSLEKRKNLALEIYKLAVLREREAKLNDALIHYRQAFKLDPDVDLGYRTYLLHTGRTETNKDEAPKDLGSLAGNSNNSDFEFIKHLHLGQDYDPISNIFAPLKAEDKGDYSAYLKKIDPLCSLIGSWYTDSESTQTTSSNESAEQKRENERPLIPMFSPSSPKQFEPLALIPEHLIVEILQHLVLSDLQSIGRFAQTCRKALVITRDERLWKFRGDMLYHPNGALYQTFNTNQVQLNTILDKKFDGSWRLFYIHAPHVRYDGVYISTCHYIRAGTAENSFNQPIHLVTYYRYMRFYTDGQFQKVLTPEEPTNVVKHLYPESKYKGLLKGHYMIRNNNIHLEMSDSARKNVTFFASLQLKSTIPGKHNKLCWLEYYSVDSNLPDSEPNYYSLKQFKAFYFSKVRSYKFDWVSFISQ